MSSTIRSVRRIACVLVAAVPAAGISAVAASAEDLGPPVATKAPDIGTRLDQNGKPRAFSDLIGKNGLVLMFFRSADWCPYCQAQLIDVNGRVTELEKRGYRIAALSYDSPEILQAQSLNSEREHAANTQSIVEAASTVTVRITTA